MSATREKRAKLRNLWEKDQVLHAQAVEEGWSDEKIASVLADLQLKGDPLEPVLAKARSEPKSEPKQKPVKRQHGVGAFTAGLRQKVSFGRNR